MRRRRWIAALVGLALVALGGCSIGDDSNEGGRPPQLGTPSDDDDAAAKLGFPTTATRNTTRVGGGDAAADAAGVASAVFPGTNEQTRPTAVVLVDSADWQAGVTAAVLAANPIGAPLLVSDDGKLPAITEDTLAQLDPKGSDLSKDAQVIRIGDAPARPGGFRLAVIQGKDPYERAAAIDRFFSAARGKPSSSVVIASGERAEFAMPAAAWAARSGDSVLLTQARRLPPATREAVERHEKPDIYVLGPESVISEDVEKALGKLGDVRRIEPAFARKDLEIEGDGPVENAIAFARYERGAFGWGATVPGYNFTIANTARPLDAAAAAILGTRGVFAPLLLTDRADELPDSLQANLLSVRPGYEDDPNDAVFNRVWILGDDKQLSLPAQAQIDQLAELTPVQSNAP